MISNFQISFISVLFFLSSLKAFSEPEIQPNPINPQLLSELKKSIKNASTDHSEQKTQESKTRLENALTQLNEEIMGKTIEGFALNSNEVLIKKVMPLEIVIGNDFTYCNKTTGKCSTLYFENFSALRHWAFGMISIDEVVDFNAKSNKPISTCLHHTPEGASRKVNRPSTDLCKKIPFFFDLYHSSQTKYKISKFYNRINVEIRLAFIYRGSPSRKADVVKLLQEGLEATKWFYARFGIKLWVHYKIEGPFYQTKSNEHIISLYDYHPRSNANSWGLMYENYDTPMSENRRKMVVTHELSHLLGLPDTYKDGACPDREEIGPIEDLMNGRLSSLIPLEYSMLFPWEIERIVSPLCDSEN